MNVIELDQSYVANTYRRFPLEIVSGKGSLVYDENGKEYIDMGTGIAVNTFGLCDPVWSSAVTLQMQKFQHTSNLYYTRPCAELAQLLCERTGMKKVFFGNSGAEANECAIKTARKYAKEKKGEDYYQIITLTGSFHGRTVTTLAATGQEVFHKEFLPLTEGFLYADPTNLSALTSLVESNKVAAILFEPVQGEGGVTALSHEFVAGMAALAKKHDILLIADEVQIGNGRSGKLYGYMNYGITPDIVTTAKGLGGGLPIGACMFGEKCEFTLGFGDHGSTFGGNPLACAGALSILQRLTDKFLEGVGKRSDYIFKKLSGARGVKSVSGMGLMIGVECDRPAAEIVAECREMGVLVLTAKAKVRLLPALNIPMDQLERAIDVLLTACAAKE
ncbi:MAG: acetylornithine/succinylornithine family transaminase [Clostridia bacterium]|nr:acetylornithine/succinylornithine family transaminase [Clostridia bacterium]